MGVDDAALFTGLVIGDDARQSPEMISAFRSSGLSHLTAVSGENVAFVLALVAPLLRRCSLRGRLVGALAVLAALLGVPVVPTAAIMGHGIYPQPIGSKGLSMVDARDIAEVAASIGAGLARAALAGQVPAAGNARSAPPDEADKHVRGRHRLRRIC